MAAITDIMIRITSIGIDPNFKPMPSVKTRTPSPPAYPIPILPSLDTKKDGGKNDNDF